MAKRILTFALAAVIGVAFAAPATAAVQSVRVGGDIVVRGIYRDNLDFISDAVGGQQSDAWLMTTTRLWVGAELTDNVSALVRLLNEREWDMDLGTGENEMSLDLAYIKVGDMFMPGLTVTLGRQEIVLGKGFVVGSRNERLLASHIGTLLLGAGMPVPTPLTGLWGAVDLSARKAFDAIRLDYEAGVIPLDLTLFGAKIAEFGLYGNNDADLWGVNAAYDTGNAVIEGYLLNLKNRFSFAGGAFPIIGPVPPFDHRSNIWTVGGRLDHEVFSVPGLAWDAEIAYQFGKAFDGTPAVDQRAWAGNLDVNYTFANPYMPVLGAAYAYYSGDDGTDATNNKNFLSMFPDGQADRVGSLWNAIAVNTGGPLALLHGGGNLASNLHAFKLYGSMSPADGHELSLAVFPAHRLDKAPAGVGKKLGWGVDLGYTYQYTEDLTLGLLGGYVRGDDDMVGPGPGVDKNAYQLIGTVALSF